MVNGNVLGNDSDPDATDVLTAAAVRDSGGGTADAWGCSSPTAPAHWWRMNGQRDVYDYDPTGQLDFFAVGESATDTFTYTVDDGNGGTDTAMVTVNVSGVNDGPDRGRRHAHRYFRRCLHDRRGNRGVVQRQRSGPGRMC